jgi:hypothetical protein
MKTIPYNFLVTKDGRLFSQADEKTPSDKKAFFADLSDIDQDGTINMFAVKKEK